MLCFSKLVCLLITIFIALPENAFPDYNGIIFDWHLFIVHDFINIDNHKIVKEESKIYREISRNLMSEEFLPNNLRLINNSLETTIDKSVLSKINVSFSTSSSFMLPYDEIQSRRDYGKFSKASSILPSLLRNPSQDMAIETLKLIEPQVNLGVEF
jgi:hypothetical protein